MSVELGLEILLALLRRVPYGSPVRPNRTWFSLCCFDNCVLCWREWLFICISYSCLYRYEQINVDFRPFSLHFYKTMSIFSNIRCIGSNDRSTWLQKPAWKFPIGEISCWRRDKFTVQYTRAYTRVPPQPLDRSPPNCTSTTWPINP